MKRILFLTATRTKTSPRPTDAARVRFTFVSCQNCNLGSQHAFRRMVFDDLRRPPAQQLDFVLHLGDFVYELVWYPEERAGGYYDRKVRELVRYPNGERIDDFHIPSDVGDYRALYRAYLADPDIQDARARWPFVSMWDNHEFSWLGWQSYQVFDGHVRGAQRRKVAANQAWFEYQPARVRTPDQAGYERFSAPAVQDAPPGTTDDAGLCRDADNLAAIGSLTGYRSLRWGTTLDLLLTDQRSYRSRDPLLEAKSSGLFSSHARQFIAQRVVAQLDAGRAFDGGRPPENLEFGQTRVSNFRHEEPPQTFLGASQKEWFLSTLSASTAVWKVWGNTIGTLDGRADLQNLPEPLRALWPDSGYGVLALDDFGNAYTERREIYDWVERHRIPGFVTLSGDRHSFWAGYAAADLDVKRFRPVGLAFVTGSVSAPGIVEALEHGLAPDHPLRPLYLVDDPSGARPHPTINMLLLHGVRSCLEYARSRDKSRALAVRNPALAPHLRFLDFAGHGFGLVDASPDSIEVEFVCIPRPATPVEAADGGPVAYRVSHRARRWAGGATPKLEQHRREGDVGLFT